MIHRKILERCLALLDIAGSDATRWHIACVDLVSNGGKVTLTATDGHKLLREEWQLACPQGHFSVFQTDKAALALLLKEWKFEDYGAVIQPNGSLEVGTIQKITILKSEKNYPQVEQVIPKPFEKRIRIGVNAEYLFQLAKAIREQKKDVPGIILELNPLNLNGPIRVLGLKPVAEKYDAVVMPMRFDKWEEAHEEVTEVYDHAERYAELIAEGRTSEAV